MGGRNTNYPASWADHPAARKDATLLFYENVKRIKAATDTLKEYNGEMPKIPDGIKESSEETATIYEKAARACKRKFMAAWNKKQEEKRETARKALREQNPKRSPAPVQNNLKRKVSSMDEVAARPAKKQALEQAVVKNGATLVNIKGRRLVCDPDDEDERELIALAREKASARPKEVNNLPSPKKKRCFEDIDSPSPEEEPLSVKKRRTQFETVREESDKENLGENTTTDIPAKDVVREVIRGNVRIIQLKAKKSGAIDFSRHLESYRASESKVLQGGEVSITRDSLPPAVAKLPKTKVPKRQPPTVANHSEPATTESGDSESVPIDLSDPSPSLTESSDSTPSLAKSSTSESTTTKSNKDKPASTKSSKSKPTPALDGPFKRGDSKEPSRRSKTKLMERMAAAAIKAAVGTTKTKKSKPSKSATPQDLDETVPSTTTNTRRPRLSLAALRRLQPVKKNKNSVEEHPLYGRRETRADRLGF